MAAYPLRTVWHQAALGLPAPNQVLKESDLDNDNMLSFSEFEHAMAKSPDFMK